MRGFLLLSVFCHIVLSYTRLCSDFAGGERIYSSEGSDITDVSSYLEYCYNDFGPYGDKIESEARCVEWNFDAHLWGFQSQHEIDWVQTNMNGGGDNMWTGLVKITFHNHDEGYGNCDETAPPMYLWIGPHPFSPANIVCKDYNYFCHDMNSGGQIEARKCVETVNNPKAICRYRIPFCDLPSYNESVCSGHGSCTEQESQGTAGVCQCDFLYTGDFCQNTFSCSGKRQDDITVCGGRGNCTDEDQCFCEEGYFGDECEFDSTNYTECTGSGEVLRGLKCYKKYPEGKDFIEAEDICREEFGGHLTTIRTLSEELFLRDEFRSFKIGLRKNFIDGDASYLYPCPPKDGYLWTDYTSTQFPLDRGQIIKCSSIKYCFGIIRNTFWDEVECANTTLPFVCSRDIYSCSGKSVLDGDVCNNRGFCLKDGSCDCYNNYIGTECQFWTCDGIRYNDQSKVNPPCSGHGECIGPNTCDCDAEYGGVNCEFSYCNGIPGSSLDVCSGHGRCVRKDFCLCDRNWGWDWCGTPFPSNLDKEPYLEKDWTNLKYINPPFDGNPGKGAWFDDYDLRTNIYGDEHYYYRNDLYGQTYPLKSIFHLKRSHIYPGPYPLESSTELYYDFNEHIGFHELEWYANNVWMPGKGHLMSIHNEDQMMFARAQRNKYFYGLPEGSAKWYKIFDIWVGAQKVIKEGLSSAEKVSALQGCNLGSDNYIKNGWTDGSDNAFIYDVRSGCCPTPDYNDGDPPFTFGGTHNGFCGKPVYCFRLGGQNVGYSPYDTDCSKPQPGLLIYNLHYCNGVIENDPNVCNGNGFCWDNEVCTCRATLKGEKSYISDDCQITSCDGINSNETNVCSSNGDCVALDTCSCDDGWYGPACNITSCWGAFTNETTEGGSGLTAVICSGHGSCYGPDECICVDSSGNYLPYFGKNCDDTYCNFELSTNTEKVCSGKGTCWPKDVCTCNATLDVTGEYCEIYKCYGEESTSYQVCSGQGTCSDVDVCECTFNDEEKYWGERCNITLCYGIFSNDTANVCGGVGVCFPYDNCVCDDGSINNCDSFVCFDHTSNEIGQVCSGLGNCTGQDLCECFNTSESSGDECQLTTCGGILSDSSSVCWGRGDCVSYDVCQCFEGKYYGGNENQCNNFTCGGYFMDDDANVCFGRGTCSDYNTCECDGDEEYDPVHPSYCEDVMCFGIGENRQPCNNGHGVCEDVNVCNCDTVDGFYGQECYEYVDHSKSVRYLYDYISQVRKFVFSYACPVFKLPESTRRAMVGLNTPVSCSSIFTEFRVGGLVDPDIFGSSPQCTVNGYPDIHSIIMVIEDAAEYLIEGTEYTFKFEFFTEAGTYYTYSLTPDFDEEDFIGGANPPYLDVNDEREENEDDEDVDNQEEEEEGTEGDEEESNLILYASLGGGSGILVLIIIILILLCICCCCLCCCCCVTLICGSRIFKKLTKDKDEANELEMNWRSVVKI